ncbi:TrkA family potassium uptake protein [filamentous cyanobacterium LEGE 11480]|uniref:TrkA family potassium uptake protein n=1 Tax=Romeriopsis navalis LEGE 11480 TaxID=2777977 RepID=A0A928VHQ3_9CYAN|nr:TrkA family potassium uptake protein [Romeriopsis navalis]MBE9028813.1 TrkA family potassium uptake protein [Romeriopsis navalis LEGE 11480]
MDLSSLGFFSSLKSGRQIKQFAVVGLGRFGRAVCETLHNQGYDVLGIDSDEERVSQALNDQIVGHARAIDSTNPCALEEAGLFEQDTVIVAIGNYIQESIITTLNLKEGGVPHLVAKASSETHSKLLKKVGADHVVFPEHDGGCSLARSLTKPGLLERFELDPEHSIVEVIVPESFDGKTIMDLQMRSRYGVNLIAHSKDGKFIVNPDPMTALQQGTAIVVVGANCDIEKLPI